MTVAHMREIPRGDWVEYRYYSTYDRVTGIVTTFSVWAQFLHPTKGGDKAVILPDFKGQDNRHRIVDPTKLVYS
jgi:hypothetical protein